MFKIKYRIVDEIDELKSIHYEFFDKDWNQVAGFIEINFGTQKEGCYYHENPLGEYEAGGELLDYWFRKLLDTVNNLYLTKYVAFQELETTNRWLEFKLIDNNVLINTAIDSKKINDKLFITEPFNGFDYVTPINFSVEFIEFKTEIVSTVSRFIAELENLNHELLKTKMVRELLQKINNLTQE